MTGIKRVWMADGWKALCEGVPLETYEAQEVRRIMVQLMTNDTTTGDLDTKVWLACAYLQRIETRKASA